MRNRSSADAAWLPPPPEVIETEQPTPESARAETVTRRAWSRSILIMDCVGVALAAALAGWTFAASQVSGGNAVPTVLLLTACAGAYLVARLLPAPVRLLVPAGVLAAAAVVVMVSPTESFARSPFVVPFGYAHFAWALFVQATVAGLMLAAGRGPLPARVAVAAVALGLASIPFGATFAGPAMFAVVLVAAVATGRRPWARVVIVASGAIVAIVLATSAYFGARYDGLERHGSVRDLLAVTSNLCRGEGCSPAGVEGAERMVFRVVTERRVALWHDALVLLREHPVFGVGPGNFMLESPIAHDERDEPWAHHELFEQGAETGWPGLALLVLLFGWGFARLLAVRQPDAVTVVGAVGLALLAVHACADFVLHHPAAPIAAAALLGFAASERRRKWA